MIARFFKNAGLGYSLKFLALLVLLGFALAKDLRTGLAIITIPIVAVGMLAPFAIRDVLVEHFELVRRILNVFAVLCIVALVLVPKSGGDEAAALRVALAVVLSLFVGVYFWVLSDDRIDRV